MGIVRQLIFSEKAAINQDELNPINKSTFVLGVAS